MGEGRGEGRSIAPFFLLIFSLLLFLSACRSPQSHVDQQMRDLRIAWHTNLLHQQNLPERKLDWPTALSLLSQNNLKLRQAEIDITNSQENVRQIFKDLLPTINLRAGVTKRLVDLANTSFDDVNFSADSFLNIPGLVSFGARLYAARLFEFRAEAAAQLTLREQSIELYKLFLTAQDIQEQERHLKNQITIAGALENVEPFSGKMMMTELELKQLSQDRDSDSLQQRAADILGNHAYHWIFLTNGLPELRYDLAPLPLSDTNRVAQLQMKLLAIEFEAARAQLTGIKLRYWPELNIFVSAPPLFQRNFGTEHFWNASELRASADVFWYLDTRGYVSRQLRQTRRQQDLQRQRYEQESLALMHKLLFTQGLLTNSVDKIKQVNFQLSVLNSIPPAQNYPALQKYSDDYRNLVDQQQKLRRDLAELQTLFWFVDENAWPKNPVAPFQGLLPPEAFPSQPATPLN